MILFYIYLVGFIATLLYTYWDELTTEPYPDFGLCWAASIFWFLVWPGVLFKTFIDFGIWCVEKFHESLINRFSKK